MSSRAIIFDDIGLIKDVDFTKRNESFVSADSGSNSAIAFATVIQTDPLRVVTSRLDGSIELFELKSTGTKWSRIASYDLECEALDMSFKDSVLMVLTDASVHIISYANGSFLSKECHPLRGGPYEQAIFMKSSLTDSASLVLCTLREQPPVLIDFFEDKIIWTAKNAADTSIGLKAVFHSQALLSLTGSVFVCADIIGKIRFYDVAVQRKPILELPIYEAFNVSNQYTGTSGMGEKRAIKQLSVSQDGNLLFVGDTLGSLLALDLSKLGGKNLKLPICDAKIGTSKHFDFCRKVLPMKFSLPGIMGSIRHVAVTDSTIFVVSAGRYAYAFDLVSKGKKSIKMFMKQKLTFCLPIESDVITQHTKDAVVESSESDDEGDVGHVLETVANIGEDDVPTSKSKRRRLRKGSSKN